MFNEGYEGGYQDGIKECEPYMREWISVKERLPHDNERYLTIDKFKIIEVEHYLPSLNDFNRTDITHWMPLPNPPIEDTSNE